ncbi:hypothetical protein LSM04_004597 [Trypanosoma melophagium]|uniref:uncharacterized protein n=1 Tax=Trypanosoma melophagium TaxID=715481 RepID=UPI00351A3A0C|nr:hypothetical protein LSM04_004597 [Trypanosoma melophagium]
MSQSRPVKGDDEGFKQRKGRIGIDSPTNCLILHSFDNQDTVPVTCVADTHQSDELHNKPPSLIALAGNENGTVMTFGCWNGKVLRRTQETDIPSVTALLVIPSYSLVWCGDEEGGITVFRLSVEQRSDDPGVCTPPILSCKTGHSSSITCLITDGNNFVYSSSIDGIITSWKLQEAVSLIRKVGQHTGKLSQILTIDNKYLLSVGPDSPAVHVWSLREEEGKDKEEPTRNVFALRGHTGGVLSSLYLEGSCNRVGTLWSGGDDCYIRIWDLNDPVHLNCRIASNSMDMKMLINDDSISENEEEMDESMQDNSIRMLIGHKSPVVALREAHGVVFSCDTSGSFLAWNPVRYWLLHAFSVPLGIGLQRVPSIAGNNDDITEVKETFNTTEVVCGARCLGFMEGFYWIMDTINGPRCVYMPSHPRLRKSLCYNEADIPDNSNEIIDEGVMMNGFVNYMQETLDFFFYYIKLHSEIFTNSVNTQLLDRNNNNNNNNNNNKKKKKKKELSISPVVVETSRYPIQSSSSSSLNNLIQGKVEKDYNDCILPSVQMNSTDVNKAQMQPMDLERKRQELQEEADRLNGKTLALDRMRAELIEMKKQQEFRDAARENLIQYLMKREQEREHQLAQVRTELSFLRLRYADWGGVVEDHI